jgi:virginiamycin B lyase
MKMRTPMLALAGALTTALAFPASGMAVTGTVTEFPLNEANSSPFGITAGPEGNVWAALKGGVTKPIVRVKPDGTRDYFTTAAGSTPYDITAASDGNLWATDQGLKQLDRITLAGVYTGFGGIGLMTPRGIAAGPNGHLYIVDAGTTPKSVVEYDPVAHAKVGNSIDLTGAANPQFIARGPDNNMWVTDFSDPGMIFRVTTTTTPVATGFTVGTGKDLLGVTAGPDGKVYFTEASATPRIGRINTDGSNVQFTSQLSGGASDPEGLSVGQDGNIYTAIFNGAQVGQIQIAPSFSVTQFKSTIPGTMGPRLITKGGDGNEWYTNESSNAIGRFTVDAIPPPSGGGGNGGGGGGGGTTNGTTPTTPVNNAGTPQVSEVAVKPSRFRVGARATAVSAAAKAKTGTTIAFVLTKDATATLSFQQALQGRKRGSNCVRINRRNRNGRKCTRFVPRGRLTRNSLQGQNAVPFTGRIGHRALKPGHYRVGVAGTDAEGRSGLFQYATFVVLPPKQKAARRGR